VTLPGNVTVAAYKPGKPSVSIAAPPADRSGPIDGGLIQWCNPAPSALLVAEHCPVSAVRRAPST